MKLRKCRSNHYTLKDLCPKCGMETKSAHYKFIKSKHSSDKED